MGHIVVIEPIEKGKDLEREIQVSVMEEDQIYVLYETGGCCSYDYETTSSITVKELYDMLGNKDKILKRMAKELNDKEKEKLNAELEWHKDALANTQRKYNEVEKENKILKKAIEIKGTKD